MVSSTPSSNSGSRPTQRQRGWQSPPPWGTLWSMAEYILPVMLLKPLLQVTDPSHKQPVRGFAPMCSFQLCGVGRQIHSISSLPAPGATHKECNLVALEIPNWKEDGCILHIKGNSIWRFGYSSGFSPLRSDHNQEWACHLQGQSSCVRSSCSRSRSSV